MHNSGFRPLSKLKRIRYQFLQASAFASFARTR